MDGSFGLFFLIPQVGPRDAQTPLEHACQPQPPNSAHKHGDIPGSEHVQLLPHMCPHPQAAGACSRLPPPALRNGARPQKRQETQPSLPGGQRGNPRFPPGSVSFGASRAFSTWSGWEGLLEAIQATPSVQKKTAPIEPRLF